MTRMRRIGVALFLLCLLHTTNAAAQRGVGAVVAMGGGDTTPDIIARTIALAGGREAVVVVLPQASSAPDAGDGAVKEWREAGAKDVRKIDFADRAAARTALERATLIWITGGDQNRFMKALEGTGLDDVIRARHGAGAVVGGTSAGAAVLSEIMITGDADLQVLHSGRTVTAQGLGIVRHVIVDQHFVRRQRHNRLISLVLDRPTAVGIGIDEATAAIVRGTRVEVIGRSAALVVDARKARIEPLTPGAIVGGTGITMHVLRDGMSMDLAR